VADYIYQIRNGAGIGVFAPQYGPRRGYYFGISQKLGDPQKVPYGSGVFFAKARPRLRSPIPGPALISARTSAARSAQASMC